MKMLIDEMPAGREMDALVATKVFRCSHVIRHISGWICQNTGQALPAYSEDIAAAWKVIDKLQDMGIIMEIGPSWLVSGKYRAIIGYPPKKRMKNDTLAATAPLAICRTALKIIGVTEV